MLTNDQVITNAARIAGTVFRERRWKYGGATSDLDYIPDEAKIEETIRYIIAEGGGSTGRLFVTPSEDGQRDIYLLLGSVRG